jgi:ankyrin repeat protein
LHNREATFKFLLERGADMSIQDKDGDTALHHLATKGNLPLLTLLLQHRQLQHSHKIDIRNDKGETPLLCAVQAGNEEAVDQLIQAGADPSAPSTAGPEGEARRQIELEFREDNRIRMQSQERAEEHIRREYNVTGHGEAFKAPLHVAAQKGHMNIVKLLINAGVDVWAAADHGIALHYAAIGEHEDVFQFLWEAGINAHRKDHFDVAAFLSTVDALEKNPHYFSQGTTNAMQEEDTKYGP